MFGMKGGDLDGMKGGESGLAGTLAPPSPLNPPSA